MSSYFKNFITLILMCCVGIFTVMPAYCSYQVGNKNFETFNGYVGRKNYFEALELTPLQIKKFEAIDVNYHKNIEPWYIKERIEWANLLELRRKKLGCFYYENKKESYPQLLIKVNSDPEVIKREAFLNAIQTKIGNDAKLIKKSYEKILTPEQKEKLNKTPILKEYLLPKPESYPFPPA